MNESGSQEIGPLRGRSRVKGLLLCGNARFTTKEVKKEEGQYRDGEGN